MERKWYRVYFQKLIIIIIPLLCYCLSRTTRVRRTHKHNTNCETVTQVALASKAGGLPEWIVLIDWWPHAFTRQGASFWCSEEAGGGSLLPSHMTRLSFLCCRQSIKLWARFPDWIGVSNNAPGPRRMGTIISSVQLKTGAILELCLVFFSPVFIWMVNRLYYNYFYKTI